MQPRTLAGVACCGLLALAQPSDPEVMARRAIERLQGGDAAAWSLLRESTDNSVRSVIVRDLSRVGPSLVVGRLRVEADVSARRALVLALGNYAADRMPPEQRDPLSSMLRRWYERDPDPGIHGAVQWSIRELGYGTAPVPRPAAPSSARRWYVTAEGQTMTAIGEPVSVRMGSPRDEAGREPAADSPAEPLHAVGIPRGFAISATEVTRAEFHRFLQSNPEAMRGHQYPGAPDRMANVLARFAPTDDSPAIAVTWYEAAMYCNWLSAREGLPESEWVYPTGVLADGTTLPADYLHRSGYRLPTEAEWEFAARAGTTTARFFGSSPHLLGEYAWFARNPPRTKDDPADPNDPQRTSPVGRLKPNDLGLFDVYGNVWEWTQDRVERHQSGRPGADREDSVLVVRDRDARTRRGGAFPYEAAMARSAARGTVTSFPTNRRDNVGFRVARTMR